MKKFKIPDAFLIGFENLRTLNQEDTNKILSILEKMPIGTGPEDFENHLDEILPLDQLKYLAPVLYSFGSLLTSQPDKSIEQVAEDLSSSFNDQNETRLSENEIKAFKVKLISIFTKCNNLKYTFKARCLITDNQRLYQESKIITDIRFVFNDDLSDINRKALIIHQLKIEHQKVDEIQEFFVSLDAKDLLKLKEQIERSLEKEKQIRNSYKNISFIEITN